MTPKKGCPYFRNERCEIERGVANPSALMFIHLRSTDPGYVERICKSDIWKQECIVYASAPMMVEGFRSVMISDNEEDDSDRKKWWQFWK